VRTHEQVHYGYGWFTMVHYGWFLDLTVPQGQLLVFEPLRGGGRGLDKLSVSYATFSTDPAFCGHFDLMIPCLCLTQTVL
jgi:hypothetical protein